MGEGAAPDVRMKQLAAPPLARVSWRPPQSAQIVTELRRTLVTQSAHLPHDGIFSHDYSPINSSGVQMTGGSQPCERMIRPIFPSISAFAKCLQFQVNKTSIS